VCTFILSQVILASRWWLLLRTQGVHIGRGPAAFSWAFLQYFYAGFAGRGYDTRMVRD
jgi:hypothetical protein